MSYYPPPGYPHIREYSLILGPRAINANLTINRLMFTIPNYPTAGAGQFQLIYLLAMGYTMKGLTKTGANTDTIAFGVGADPTLNTIDLGATGGVLATHPAGTNFSWSGPVGGQYNSIPNINAIELDQFDGAGTVGAALILDITLGLGSTLDWTAFTGYVLIGSPVFT